MAQESYADFSIIQKYLDQKRYHDEELKTHQSKIVELEHSLATMKDELDAKDQAITQLKSKLAETTSQSSEKGDSTQGVNPHTSQLNGRSPGMKEPFIEEAVSQKGKLDFLKK